MYIKQLSPREFFAYRNMIFLRLQARNRNFPREYNSDGTPKLNYYEIRYIEINEMYPWLAGTGEWKFKDKYLELKNIEKGS